MPHPDIIVIGASAGGLEALQVLVRDLPRDLAAAIFVVWHISPHSPGLLPEILERAGNLPAENAAHMARIDRGRIYAAPADHHLLVESGHMETTRGPKENRFRPAVDPLFRSAAAAFGPRVIGVVLSGALDDGTAGLRAVKQRGGIAVVQHPGDALVPSMPQSALNTVEVDHCVPISAMGALLVRLVDTQILEGGAGEVSEELEIEVGIAREDNAIEAGVETLGELSPFACPECHGTLRELKEAGHIRFRCHTGHAYTAQSLLSEATEVIENYLWTSIRGLEETVLLLRHLASHLAQQGHRDQAAALLENAEQAQRRSNLVRQAVMQRERPSREEQD